MIAAIKDITKKQGEHDGDRFFFPNLQEFALGKGEAPKVLTCAI